MLWLICWFSRLAKPWLNLGVDGQCTDHSGAECAECQSGKVWSCLHGVSWYLSTLPLVSWHRLLHAGLACWNCGLAKRRVLPWNCRNMSSVLDLACLAPWTLTWTRCLKNMCCFVSPMLCVHGLPKCTCPHMTGITCPISSCKVPCYLQMFLTLVLSVVVLHVFVPVRNQVSLSCFLISLAWWCGPWLIGCSRRV